MNNDLDRMQGLDAALSNPPHIGDCGFSDAVNNSIEEANSKRHKVFWIIATCWITITSLLILQDYLTIQSLQLSTTLHLPRQLYFAFNQISDSILVFISASLANLIAVCLSFIAVASFLRRDR